MFIPIIKFVKTREFFLKRIIRHTYYTYGTTVINQTNQCGSAVRAFLVCQRSTDWRRNGRRLMGDCSNGIFVMNDS